MQRYLINLDRSTDRLATFRQRNAHLNGVVRIPGIDGRLLDREKLVADGLATPDCVYGPGSLGSALSHVSLWRTAVAENRAITVFEDDSIASFQFDEVSERLLASAPKDWDFIKWGHLYKPGYVWLDFGHSKATLRFYDSRFRGDDRLEFQSAEFAWNLMKFAHSFGSQCYSVSPKGARLLLDHCLPLRNGHVEFPGAGVVTHNNCIDVAMCGAYQGMQAYLSMPPLVIHDDGQHSERETLNAIAQ